ncbi:hypothetical protein [Crocosphaera sp.]
MHYTKTAESNWLIQEYEDEKPIIQLTTVPIKINIRDVYEGVNVGETEI